jgi:hypothetical protein
MSYIVNLPNGDLLTTILDGTVDTTASSLTLVGRNYSGYGEIIAEDLVFLLVNFSNNVSPANPNTGQIWYDSGNKLCKVYTGTAWKNIGSATYASTAPNTTVGGDFWWDSVNKQLYCYDGSSPYNIAGWILVGPGYSVVLGKSGAIFEQISDGAISHDVVSMYLDGTRTAIISQDTFTPNVAIAGFSGAIQIGWNMSSTTTKGYIWGTANNASYLGGQPAANYFRNNINNSGTGTLSIVNNNGLTVGTFGQFVANITGNNISLQNTISGSLSLAVLGNTALSVTSSGQVTVNTDPSQALGVATKQYVDNRFINANLWGVSTAITAPALTANTMIATTEFVRNYSGFFSYKIYQGDSHMWFSDTGVGGANLVIDGQTVLSAISSGVSLNNGATATTQSQTYNATGDSRIATTAYAKTAATWWGGSAKFVSNAAPNAGVNDIGSNDGDFWFQYAN